MTGHLSTIRCLHLHISAGAFGSRGGRRLKISFKLSVSWCRTQAEVSVVRLHSSGGCVSRTQQVRKQARMQRVREYFYGVRGDLSPASQTARLDDLRIYRIGGGPRAPTSALPLGLFPAPNCCKLSTSLSLKQIPITCLCQAIWLRL